MPTRPATNDALPRRLRRTTRATWAVAGAVIAAFMGIVTTHAWQNYAAIDLRAGDMAQHLARMAAEQAGFVLDEVTIVLEDIRLDIRAGVTGLSPDAEQSRGLSARLARLPQLAGLMLIDAGGVTQARVGKGPRRGDLADAPFVAAHRDERRIEPYYGAIDAVASSGEPMLVVSLPLAGPGDSFAGVVVGFIDPAFFNAHHRSVAGKVVPPGFDAAATMVALARPDGTTLIAPPHGAANLFRVPSIAGPGEAVRDRTAGVVNRIVGDAGSHRHVFAWHGLADGTLVAWVAFDSDEIVAAWWTTDGGYLLTSSGAAVAVILFTLFAARQTTRRGEAELALRQRQDRLRGIMDNMVDGVITADHAGIVESFSPAAERMFGYTAREVVGRNISMLMTHSERSSHDGYLETYLSTGRRTIIGVGPRELTARRGDGSEFAMDIAISEMLQGGRRVFIATVRDITDRHEAREALYRSEQSLVNAQRIARFGNWDMDLATGRMRWSDEVYRILGLKLNQVAPTRASYYQRVNVADRKRLREANEAAIAERRSFGIDYRVVLPDGTMRTVHEEAEFVFDDDGKAVSVSGTIQDVSERKEAQLALRRSRRTLRTVIDAVPAVINAKDREGRYVLMNAFQADILGVDPRDAIGRTSEELAEPGHAEWVRDNDAKVISTGEPIANLEFTGKDKDGRDRIWLASKTPVSDVSGEVTTVVTVAFDITERKEAEQELRTALEAAETANRAKSAFLATMSHELRTPLNAIIGFSEILKDEMFGPLGSKQYSDYAGDIHESGAHLLQLINDILEISKADIGTLELDEGEVDTRAVIDDVLMLITARAEARNLKVETDLPENLPRLRGDAGKIRQALTHILSNAIKFTPPPGTLRVSAGTNDDGGLVISVRDTGIGIAEGDLETVMAPFGQADSKLERKYEGGGLGLPLAKTVTELHGGTLTIKSTVGVGTIVTLNFPAERVLAGRSAA